ncbi:MAG: helix-turn-helix domain-containing protein [Tsuneonella sp.]
MAINAHFESTANEPGTPRAPRRTLKFDATGERASGDAAEVTVHNASTTGLLIECAEPLAEGEQIAIDLPHTGRTMAHVVWSSGRLYGCRFQTPVSRATLSAAQLRSAVGESVELAPSAPVSGGGTLGSRLQQLRKARGLTLANLADALGVSKPTVWAWEHGKARPVEGRFDALAAALGVGRDELTPSRSSAVSDELVDRCRSQIAEAAGVGPANVRIFIEL